MVSRPLQRWILLILLAATSVYYLSRLHYFENDSRLSFLFSSGSDSVDWSKVPEANPLTSFIPLPTGSPKKLPRIQAETFPKESEGQEKERLNRLSAVKEVFMHSWNGYRKHAFLHDEISPITTAWKDHYGGWGATLVDALDSLLIMGLHDEFSEAVEALKKVDFSTTHVLTLNVFETTIRFLGGMISAYDLCEGKERDVLLEKIKQLGEMLYHSFDTVNRMPVTRWYWQNTASSIAQEPHSYTLAAEFASLTLEFTRLTQITGDERFYDAVQRVSDVLEKTQNDTKLPGLWPVIFNAQTLSFSGDGTFTFGGRADSMYEYIPKEYILLGGQSEQYRSMYEKFIEKAKDHLFFRPMTPKNLDILISGTARVHLEKDVTLHPEGQHLSCFVGGMVGVASKIFQRTQDMDVARKLVDGCIWAYESTATGIMPEIFMALPPVGNKKNKWDKSRWLKAVNEQHSMSLENEVKDIEARAEKLIESLRLPDGMTAIPDRRYILRPEAIESVFVLYRITGEKKYQDAAWKMFNAIKAVTKTKDSYAAITDVTTEDPDLIDSSESFWMGETLKYFYLIFSEPSVISLDEWVLNTEAHPLRRNLT